MLSRLQEDLALDQRDVLRFVGITGLPGAGKGAFVDLLVPQLAERGYESRYYSLSDELRAEARRRGLPVERPVLRRIANELREERGGGVLSLLVLAQVRKDLVRIAPGTRLVVMIDAIRNPEEVETLREELGSAFVLVGVEAPLDLLVARIAARARFDEPEAVVHEREAARRMIQGEAGKGEPAHGHNIAACVEMADWRVDNSGSLEELAAQVQRFTTELLPEHSP
jgi:dephospho-CoA kinase